MACNDEASIGWVDCGKILNVIHCLNIFVPYHHVADVRDYRGYGQHPHSRQNIDALERVAIARDRNLAHRSHPVLPQTLPEFLQFLHIRTTRTNLRGIRATGRTQSLLGGFIPWSWYDIGEKLVLLPFLMDLLVYCLPLVLVVGRNLQLYQRDPAFRPFAINPALVH